MVHFFRECTNLYCIFLSFRSIQIFQHEYIQFLSLICFSLPWNALNRNFQFILFDEGTKQQRQNVTWYRIVFWKETKSTFVLYICFFKKSTGVYSDPLTSRTSNWNILFKLCIDCCSSAEPEAARDSTYSEVLGVSANPISTKLQMSCSNDIFRWSIHRPCYKIDFTASLNHKDGSGLSSFRENRNL